MTREVEGTVRHMYSSGDGCMCCPGRHRYGSLVEGIPFSGGGWIHDMIRGLPDGTRVRLTLTVVDEATVEIASEVMDR